MRLVSASANNCSDFCLNVGVDWHATYDDLAKLSDGRHFSGFEGLPLNKLLDMNMSQAVSHTIPSHMCPALLLQSFVACLGVGLRVRATCLSPGGSRRLVLVTAPWTLTVHVRHPMCVRCKE